MYGFLVDHPMHAAFKLIARPLRQHTPYINNIGVRFRGDRLEGVRIGTKDLLP